MQFQVPQFIEVEDKIFGPLTFKQFIYLGGGGGLSVLLFLFLPGLIAWPLILVIVALSVALAFYKINNRPFVNVLESAVRYSTGGKLYIWKKKTKKATPQSRKADVSDPLANLYVPHLSDSKLKDLSWSLDVQEGARRADS